MSLVDGMMETFRIAAKLKRVMLKKNLRKAKAPCPKCPDKFVNGTINGPRDHLHFRCDCGKMIMME